MIPLLRTMRCASMFRRGLSLLELLLALTITMMVAAAIAGMLGAVSSGVGVRRDSRTVMVLSNAAESRLSAYIAASRCVLDADSPNLVLWLRDSRESQTVHATEIRWLKFDQAAGSIDVFYVDFPDDWSQAAKDLEDDEYPSNANWQSVLTAYSNSGWIRARTLVDNLGDVSIETDNATDLDARQVQYNLEFSTESGQTPMVVTCTIRQHEAPAK